VKWTGGRLLQWVASVSSRVRLVCLSSDTCPQPDVAKGQSWAKPDSRNGNDDTPQVGRLKPRADIAAAVQCRNRSRIARCNARPETYPKPRALLRLNFSDVRRVNELTLLPTRLFCSPIGRSHPSPPPLARLSSCWRHRHRRCESSFDSQEARRQDCGRIRAASY
jgi:hypothetical protein